MNAMNVRNAKPYEHNPMLPVPYVTTGDRKIQIDCILALGANLPAASEFSEILQKFYPKRKFENCLEWCSGPGCVGFEALSRNICSHITFMDKHKPAIDNVLETVKINDLHDEISTIVAEKISQLPNKKYDLVLGNPPHFSKKLFPKHDGEDSYRRSIDQDLKIHREFFETISNYLTDDGVIIISGTYSKKHTKEIGINPHTLFPLIKESSLELITTLGTVSKISGVYYTLLSKKI